MAERVWKVSELIRQINVELFRYNDISVEGEATNVVRSAAGHIYFSIKDSRAQMRVVLFATNSRFLRFRIENGLQLVVRGRLTLYEQKGEFQLNAVAVEPAGKTGIDGTPAAPRLFVPKNLKSAWAADRKNRLDG